MNYLAVVASEKCRVCGCSKLKPCILQLCQGEPVVACTWLDSDHTLCSNFRCIALTPLAELLQLRSLRAVAP
jgi:hypothetical protein